MQFRQLGARRQQHLDERKCFSRAIIHFVHLHAYCRGVHIQEVPLQWLVWVVPSKPTCWRLRVVGQLCCSEHRPQPVRMRFLPPSRDEVPVKKKAVPLPYCDVERTLVDTAWVEPYQAVHVVERIHQRRGAHVQSRA